MSQVGFWRDFLVRLGYGRVQRGDLTLLRNLVLRNSPFDFSSPPRIDAPLINPRPSIPAEDLL